MVINYLHPMNLITPANTICKKGESPVHQREAVEAAGRSGKNQIPAPDASGL
jgi:hypothetical protein